MADYFELRDLVEPLLSDDEFHAWNFLFRPLFDDTDAEAALSIVQKMALSIEENVRVRRSRKRDATDDRLRHGVLPTEDDKIEDDIDSQKIESVTPRDYQLKYFELVKSKNIIAHLGTGLGKTLIAMLATKYFLEQTRDSKARQVLFLVPTISLTEQHSRSFKKNSLTASYSVKALNGSTSNTKDEALQKMANVDVLISTHGVSYRILFHFFLKRYVHVWAFFKALLDLYRHHKDLFYLSRVALLIFDECHHVSAGNHGYSRFMSEIYWKEPKENRPRILGLTASPCSNFNGEEDLQTQFG